MMAPCTPLFFKKKGKKEKKNINWATLTQPWQLHIKSEQWKGGGIGN